jgi:coiled-coil domain-containing protein 6
LAREATETPGKGKEKDQLQSVKENNLGGNSTATNSKNGESSGSREQRDTSRNGIVPPDPEPSLLLDALRRENEELRARLGKVEKDYVRVKRLNEVYREELIVRRGRVRFLFSCLFLLLSIING